MEWLILFAIIISAYLIIKAIREQGPEGQTKKINKEIESIKTAVEFFRSVVMKKEPELIESEILEELRQDLLTMEEKYFRLKERYKNDFKKLLEITKDWVNYSDSLKTLHFAWCILETDLSETATDNYDEKVAEPRIKKDEIEKKWNNLLMK